MNSMINQIAEAQLKELIRLLRKEMKCQRVNSEYWNNSKRAIESYIGSIRKLRYENKKVV
jgi:FlaA1/EpsC-like NDP-sugar epimerase